VSSGTHKLDRIDELVNKLATTLGPELRKCAAALDDADPCPIHPYMARAKRAFIEAVKMHTGGASEVASLVPCNESNIRWQQENPRRSPQLNVVYAMNPDAMDRVADDLRAAAAEKRMLRRAG
jgi:hypothetical protein